MIKEQLLDELTDLIANNYISGIGSFIADLNHTLDELIAKSDKIYITLSALIAAQLHEGETYQSLAKEHVDVLKDIDSIIVVRKRAQQALDIFNNGDKIIKNAKEWR